MLLTDYLLLCVSATANESTRKRVIFYTVGEYILLAAASALQVIYIRQLFSKSVAYNRVWAALVIVNVFLALGEA